MKNNIKNKKRGSQLLDIRLSNMPKPLFIIFVSFTLIGLLIAVYHMFGLVLFGFVMLDIHYYFLLMALFMPLAFLSRPARKKDKQIIPWYDIILSIIAFTIPLFFVPLAHTLSFIGMIPAPVRYLIPAILFILLCVETGRRIASNIYVIICLMLGLYPIIADKMPGIISGFSFSFSETISLVAFGTEGILGIPSRVMGNILMGFLLFAGFMIATGAGDFFLEIAFALAGRFRGGTAKTAVIASGFFGSLSGNSMTNVISTGSFTIPAMKESGVSPELAGAVESVASAGGHIMPPVMGGVAFVMTVFLGMDYADLMIAAIIPAILYYLSVFVSVDSYAAKNEIKPIPKDKIPSVMETIKKGWIHLIALSFLVFGLIYMRWGMRAPFYTTALMFVISFFSKETRLSLKGFINAIASVGKLIAQSFAILMPMGFIINGLVVTGVTSSLTASAIALGGGEVFLVLLIGFISCYIMGMAGLLSPAYIFLAVSMAPAVLALGEFDVLAVHFFILYYIKFAVFSLPVAGGAFIAASIADGNPIKTAATCMRIAAPAYFIPFFFVFNPSLILRGNLLETLYLFPLAIIGVILIASATMGYLIRVGILPLWTRLPIIIAGVLIGFPETKSTMAGFLLLFTILIIKVLVESYFYKKA